MGREFCEALAREKQAIIALLQGQHDDYRDTSPGSQASSPARLVQASSAHPPVVPPPPTPVRPGWLVAFRDASGRLRGGCKEPEQGTVKEARFIADGWCLTVMDGTVLKARQVVAVTETDSAGRVVAAWQTARFGLTGRHALEWPE
jgi:hypothetical protein